jgi:hypothetical protein
MNVPIKCPRCSQAFAAPENVRGQRVRCPRCNEIVTIPPPVMTRSHGSELAELIDDETKPSKPQRPVASPETQKTIAALGIPQNSWWPFKSEPPEETADAGPGEVWQARPSELSLFLATHKLVLAAVLLSFAFFVFVVFSLREPLWASLSGAGVVIALTDGISENALLLFAACLTSAGVLAAIGTWRSQQFDGVERRIAERWRTFELWFGVLLLATIAVWVTWRIGVQLNFFVELSQQIGFHRKMLGPIVGLILLWLIIVAECALVLFNAQRQGFFRMLSATFVANYFLIPLTGVVFYFCLMDFLDHNAPGGQLAIRSDRAWSQVAPTSSAPSVSTQPELSEFEKILAARAAKFSGPAKPDDGAGAGKIADLERAVKSQLDDGLDGPRKLGFIAWRTKPDPAAKSDATAVAKQPAIALPDNHEIVVPDEGGQFAVVRTNAAQESSTFELWNLAQNKSIGKIPSNADLATALTLSRDGKYLAGIGKGGRAVEIWTFGASQPLARAAIPRSEGQAQILFIDDKRILVVCPEHDDCKLFVVPIAADPEPREVVLPTAIKLVGNGYAVSPGGHFFAVSDAHRIWLVDLASGKLCGALAIPQASERQEAAGMKFSPDGSELALLIWSPSAGSRLLAWSTADGSPTADHTLTYEAPRDANQSEPLLYFADKQYWLLDGKAAVDRRTGRVWPISQPKLQGAFSDALSVKGFADDVHLALASSKMLSTWELPSDVSGKLDPSKLNISVNDLPEGMLGSAKIAEREKPLEGVELRTASRNYRAAAMIDMLSRDDDEFAGMLHWYPGAKQPVLGMRWGIGIVAPGVEPASPSTGFDISKWTGIVGGNVVKQIDKRIDAGDFGAWPQRGESRIRHLIPLGIGDREGLLSTAADLGLDCVVILELAEQTVGTATDVTLKARISDVSGQPQWTSASLSNQRFTPRAAANLMTQFTGQIGSQLVANFKLRAIPAIKPTEAEARTKLLAALTPADMFSALAEVRFYQVKKLISADLAATAYVKWLGDAEGRAFAIGDGRQRRAILMQWWEQKNPATSAAATPAVE